MRTLGAILLGLGLTSFTLGILPVLPEQSNALFTCGLLVSCIGLLLLFLSSSSA